MYQMLVVLLLFLVHLLLLSGSLVCSCVLFLGGRLALRLGHNLTVLKGLQGSLTMCDELL